MSLKTDTPTTEPVQDRNLSCGSGRDRLEEAVLQRYAAGAAEREEGLCCPTSHFDATYLGVLPQEIIEKDYGCGDPSAHARAGDTVIDLGSGAGKVCYVLAQRVGPTGRVFGIDFNDAMLSLARKHHRQVTEQIGYDNVSFHKARIQDLALDLERVAEFLCEHPVATLDDLDRFQAFCERVRREEPLLAGDSVDLIVSNCVLNLVRPSDKPRLFEEMFRVLRPGGRIVISDIVCDEEPPESVRSDPDLWSGCIAGAYREDRLLQTFADTGFYGVEILSRQAEPWQVVEGIEFRSMTVRAFKPESSPCLDHGQAIIYRGPWQAVLDDDGHRFERGRYMAVCDRTFRKMTDPNGPYAGDVIGLEPAEPIAPDEVKPFPCGGPRERSPQALRGATVEDVSSCDGNGCC